MADEEFDYVVVGAGSAGCALAYRLVTETDASVLLVEAGGPDTKPEIHDERLSSTMSLWGGGDWDWGYATEPQAALGGRTIPVARGKVWGGSSSINAMVHVRGNRRDYDNWAALGNTGWGYDDVLPYLKRLENYAGGASQYRGDDGPVSVIRHASPSPVSEQLFPATEEIGMPQRGPDFDYNAENQAESPFYYQTTKTRDHHRASTAVAYLYPIKDAPNFTIRSNSLVTRLLTSGTKITGVRYRQDGRTVDVAAAREVIVCAGAYETPKLLMLSGIGPADTLRSYGIDVVADLPGVGQNLQDHMILGICYLSLRDDAAEPTLIAETGFFTQTRDDATATDSPDLQMKFGALKFVSPQYDRDGAGFTFAPVIIQPRSVGTVGLRSTDPSDRAVVQPNFLADEADVECFLKGIELSRALAATKALADFTKVEIAPGPDVTSRSDLVDFIRGNASTLWHPVGTCSLGSVVGSDLTVNGVTGLRVADASVMPRIVAGNTNAACIMIGEKAADLVQKGTGHV
jgi:choline dehydrogenase